jgi:ABC-type multidrug transport system ATPase subunit
MGEALVDLDGIGITITSVPILTEVTLRLDPGQVIGIAGPNGAGKTTLLSVVATLVAPTSGEGTVLGARLGTREVVTIRPRIGWSGHDAGLYPELTLAENMRLWATVAGMSDQAADDALDLVGLAAAGGRRADHSSNGMQRRVDLARLLMLDPGLLLLDEAHAGLDADAESIVDELIHRVRQRGGGAVLVSHDTARLAGRVDRVETLIEGRLGR